MQRLLFGSQWGSTAPEEMRHLLLEISFKSIGIFLFMLALQARRSVGCRITHGCRELGVRIARVADVISRDIRGEHVLEVLPGGSHSLPIR